MKIQIIGYSGSGKSTLAKQLAQKLGGCPLYLDTLHFYGDWQERTAEEMTLLVRQFLAEHDIWVIDGNYTQVAPERFKQADLIVFLDRNRFACFFSAFSRYLKHRRTVRESCGCPEKFDWEFILWLLYKGRGKDKKQALLNQAAGQKIILKNRRQIRRFVSQFQ